MYYKAKSKVNWPVVITVGVAIFFLVTIVSILVFNLFKNKEVVTDENKVVNNAIPKVELSLNTEEENQTQVYIKVKVSTTDVAGLAKITVTGGEEIVIEKENQTYYETTFTAKENATYEIQAYGKNGVFGSQQIKVSNIKTFSAKEPYIPINFTKVEGTEVNNGLVVKDQSGNEYVWIPVSGGRLTRNRDETDSKYYEGSPEESQFRNSVAKYHGFYIARYEASVFSVNDKEIAGSKPGYNPTSRITYLKASKLSKEVADAYNYEGFQTSIISSSAWDTTLAWLDKAVSGYSSSLDYGNYSGARNNTGSTTKDNIQNVFDISGNLSEWTSESYRLSEDERRELSRNESLNEDEDYKIIRGGSATNKSTAKRATRGNPNSAYENIGFRYLLYKD